MVANEMEAVDAVWIILSAFIVFTMQTGFALLESGLVSVKSKTNIMVKSVLDVCFGGIAYWFVGYGISFGLNTTKGNSFTGNGQFMTDVDISTDAKVYIKFFFQLSFASASTTIISGAVAERIHLFAYMIIVIINTGVIYVFPAHWIWDSNGWLFKKGAHDFAGSGVVHMAGGAAALMTAYIIGPRYGKFDEPKKLYKISSGSNVVLGTFFLWWGWIGFNCGSTFIISNGTWKIASRVAVVTMNGAMAGGISGIIFSILLRKKRKYIIDVTELSSGLLAGVVSITACSDVIRPWEGLFIGFCGGFIANGTIKLVELLKIDDPVGAFGVHYAAGFWSMIATGLFADTGPENPSVNGGLFRKGNGQLLAYNIVAIIVISLWSGGLNAITFWIIKKTIGVRMSVDEEIIGVDKIELNDSNEQEYVSKSIIEAGTSSRMNILSTAAPHSVVKEKSLQEIIPSKKQILSTGSISKLKDTKL